jgi:hypothetical protein
MKALILVELKKQNKKYTPKNTPASSMLPLFFAKSVYLVAQI